MTGCRRVMSARGENTENPASPLPTLTRVVSPRMVPAASWGSRSVTSTVSPAINGRPSDTVTPTDPPSATTPSSDESVNTRLAGIGVVFPMARVSPLTSLPRLVVPVRVIVSPGS